MALTPKIKLLRVLSVLQTLVAVWLVVLGIVEHVRVDWSHSGVGIAIWTGVWVGITGAFGVFITFKRVQNSSCGSLIAAHLVMTFMGFSLTCGILSALYLHLYSYDLSVARSQQIRWITLSYKSEGEVVRNPITFDKRDKEQHGLVGSIFGFMVVELILAMWSVGICLVNDRQQALSSEDEPMTSVVYETGQGVVMGQGHGGFPVAIPMQQAGGVPSVHPQMVHLPATGVAHVAGQPPMYPVPTAGYVPSTGAGGGQVDAAHGAPGAQGSQAQFVGVGPDGALKGGPGT